MYAASHSEEHVRDNTQQKLDYLNQVFTLQKKHFRIPPYHERITQLDLLYDLLKQEKDNIVQAISKDYGYRSTDETLALEILPSLECIKFTKNKLKKWMKPSSRRLSILNKPAKAKVINQPFGTVGIIVPWNYPLYLSIGPLVSAIAAGNRCILKLSEYTPNFSDYFAKLIRTHFSADRVCVITGDAQVAKAFSKLAFDKILFTGSTEVGQHVMRAASDNLTPVILELGGKSPVLIHDDYAMNKAVQRIMHGKLLNAGQTCVAPDYVLLTPQQEDKFVEFAKRQVKKMYPKLAENKDYSNIINSKQKQRLEYLINDAINKGANYIPLGDDNKLNFTDTKLQPCILSKVNDTMAVMQEEIFGPILLIKTVNTIEDGINYINSKPHPLAIYLFSHNKKVIDNVLNITQSGALTLNDTVIHVAQDALPFGGIGASGMGAYHGYEGYLGFSHQRAVMKQGRYSSFARIRPPYGKFFQLFKKLTIGE